MDAQQVRLRALGRLLILVPYLVWAATILGLAWVAGQLTNFIGLWGMILIAPILFGMAGIMGLYESVNQYRSDISATSDHLTFVEDVLEPVARGCRYAVLLPIAMTWLYLGMKFRSTESMRSDLSRLLTGKE